MKQRITYVVKDPDSFTPEQLEVKKDSHESTFSVKDLQAAKEHRITLGLDELHSEISTAIQQWHEFHVRWVSPKPYTSTPPFTSRVSPGLHIFFTPSDAATDDAFCDQIHNFFDPKAKCTSRNETSIKLPAISERFSMSAASQYYHFLPSIQESLEKFSKRICRRSDSTCGTMIESLTKASYVDIDYDTIARSVIINAGWPSAPDSKGWTETITRKTAGKQGTTEIGVLTHEPNPDPEDIGFGGFLVVLGESSEPKPTRFQTPTRHYPLLTSSTPPLPHPITYTITFATPTGLHPTLVLTFPTQHLVPPNPSCKLHTHLTLPSALFIDKYQFTDPIFLASKNIAALRSLAGATDLEAPDWVVKEWGSAALFELTSHSPSTSTSTSTSKQTSQHFNVSIPLHARYLPASHTPSTLIPIPHPVVFWACRADEGAKMAANPFDRVHLGYEALFGAKTRFMHVEPKGDRELVVWIDVPVLDLERTGWVQVGTLGTVVGAFLGLCWVLFGRGVGGGKGKKKGKKQ